MSECIKKLKESVLKIINIEGKSVDDALLTKLCEDKKLKEILEGASAEEEKARCANEPLVEKEEVKVRKQKPIHTIARKESPVKNKTNPPVATISHNPKEKVGRLDDELQEKLDRLTAAVNYYREKCLHEGEVIQSLEEEMVALRKRVKTVNCALKALEEKHELTLVKCEREIDASFRADLEKLF